MDDRQLLEDIVKQSQTQPVLVDFWAEWCQPCKTLGPTLEKLERESGGSWVLVKVDVDQYPMLAQQFGVQGIPAVKLIHRGQLVDEFTGAYPEAEIIKFLARHVAPPAPAEDESTATVDEWMAAGEYDRARAALEQLLAKEPKNEETWLKYGQCWVFSNTEKAKEALTNVQEESKHVDRAASIGYLIQMLETQPAELPESKVKTYYADALNALRKKDFTAALDQFFEVLIRDREYMEDGARRAFIAIFDFLTRQHPVSKAYARRFEMAVFS